MQRLLRLAYPPQCVACGDLVDEDFGLCSACWKDTPFINGLICDTCSVPLPGAEPDTLIKCDDCLAIARPWARGRAAMIYKDQARRMVLGLKHGDRLELVTPMACWMMGVAMPLFADDTVLVPIPLHPFRLLRRRYNQSALLSNALARLSKRPTIPDLLVRARRTVPQDGMSLDARFKNQAESIKPSKHGAQKLAGRAVLLIDDVMTSGATMAAAADACHLIGARRVDILTLARVVKDA